MGYKTRSVYTIAACINTVPCKHDGIKCKQCLHKNKYKPIKKDVKK